MTSAHLTGRTAIITGASRGIGLAVAQRLADAGANVVLTSRKQENADAAAAQVGGTALGVAAHAVDEDAARRCVDLALERFGSVDILVNNAGTNPAFSRTTPLSRRFSTSICGRRCCGRRWPSKRGWVSTAVPWSIPHRSAAWRSRPTLACTTPRSLR